MKVTPSNVIYFLIYVHNLPSQWNSANSAGEQSSDLFSKYL